MGSGGVAIAALPTVICLKVPFSDGLGGRKPLALSHWPLAFLSKQVILSTIKIR